MTVALTDKHDLDRAHLVRQTFGDRALESEVLDLFERQCRRLLSLIAGAASPSERADAAHTLVGAARGVGAWRVASAAESLEAALVDGLGSESPIRLVAALEAAIESARAAIAERGDEPA